MPWWAWLLLALYITGCVMAIPRIGYVIASDSAYGNLDGDDVAFGLIFGIFLCGLWPLLLPAYRWYEFQKGRGTAYAKFLVAPRPVRRRQELARREAAMEKREQRIAKLEHELGLDHENEGG